MMRLEKSFLNLSVFSLVLLLSSLLLVSSVFAQTFFNVTVSPTSVNASTANQLFNFTIGNSHSNPIFNISRVQINTPGGAGFNFITGSNNTNASNTYARNSSFSTTIIQFDIFSAQEMVWQNATPQNFTLGLIPTATKVDFSFNASVPLTKDTSMFFISVTFSDGITTQNTMVQVPVTIVNPTGTVSLLGPANASTQSVNEFNLTFNVTGTSATYFCLGLQNMTTPFGQQITPMPAPPMWNVSNNINTNMSVFMSNGVYLWNVKCTPKPTIQAFRDNSGYNFSSGGQAITGAGIKVGDQVNFTNTLNMDINITISVPFSVGFTFNISAGKSYILDTTPNFTAAKPPLLGPLSDSLNNRTFLGSPFMGDPFNSPGIQATNNFTLTVNGTFMPIFDPGVFFNPTSGFNFATGPCSQPSPPPFCSTTNFNATDTTFFDRNQEFAFHGFADFDECASNPNTADCKMILDPTASFTDTSGPPNILNIHAVGFADMIIVDFPTDKFTNASVSYYGIDNYCGSAVGTVKDEGARDTAGNLLTNSQYKPFHHIEISNYTLPSVTLSPNVTYYYKINVWDRAGNSVASSCKNVNTSVTGFTDMRFTFNFTPPTGISNFAFKMVLPNGSISTLSSSSSLAGFRNITMRLAPEGATWGIDLPGVTLGANSSFNLANGFVTSGIGGSRPLVGMNHTVWETLAQRLGVKAINLTLPFTDTTIYKCDDNGANCIDASRLATRVAVNTTAGTSVWTIPITLGFSTYSNLASAPSTAAAAATSGGGGSGGLTTTTGKITKSFTSITTLIPKTIDEITLKDSNTKLTEIYIAVANRVVNVKITVEKLDAKPTSITQDVSGKVYEYMDISQENLNETDIASAKIKFKVAQSWITNNSIDTAKVYLYRYANNQWNQLNTTKISEDTNYVYYEVVTPGFSTFAISGEPKVEAVPPACVENWSCTEWTECVEEKQTRTCTDANKCGTTVNKPAEEKSCISLPGIVTPGLPSWITPIIIVVVVVLVLIYLVKKGIIKLPE